MRILALCAVTWALPASAILVGGGGSKRTDCLLALDAPLNHPPDNPRRVRCVDGDPACDADATVEQGAPNVASRFFQVRNGGYDTHADQGGALPGDRHYDLHAEVGNALETFFADLDDMGIAHKVCVVVWSEFSRRIPQNQNGTDHGTQGPMFVIGGAVIGGLYGNHPNIDPLALDGNGNSLYSQAGGDPHRSTDFRDVYGTVLKHWLNMPEPTILSDVFLTDPGPADSYWTVPDFDLGFLP